ncbi:hypothetical protein JCM11641_002205 [Rhodosporidiobolus odoratus]
MPRKAKAKPKSPTPEPEDPPETSEAEESSDEEQVYVEPNLASRSRRNNAGNRMQALIDDEAQAEVDEMFKEEENDEEFAHKEERDEFDSDFGSTDEGEGDEDDEEAGERKLQREANEEKKAAKGKKKKGFQAPVHPFARQTKAQRTKAARTADTQGGTVASTSASTLDEEGQPAKKRKKKSDLNPAFLVPQRESSRRNAVKNKQEVQERLQETEKKKKPVKVAKKSRGPTLTQADLIAEALETEEVNRAALLAFYAAEDDRRERERVSGMRYEIIGPKISFLSRAIGGSDNKGKGKEKEEKGRKRMIEVLGESGKVGWKAGAAERGETGPAASGSSATTPGPASFANLLNPSSNPGSPAPVAPYEEGPSTPPERQEVTRNWLIFGNTEEEPITEGQELEAIFGDHEDWAKEPAVPAKSRDGMEGRGYLCPITGLPAKYRDPVTLTPYATLAAYKILQSLTTSTPITPSPYIYSDSLGAYTGTSGLGLIGEIEQSWSRRPGAPKPMTMATRHGASPAVAPSPAAPTGSVATPSHVFPPLPAVNQAAPSFSATPNGMAKKPRAPRASAVAENPYKMEYASAGGSGRGQRGRASLGDIVVGGEGAPGTPIPGPGGFSPHTQQYQQSPGYFQQQQPSAYAYPPHPMPHNTFPPSVAYSPSPLVGSPFPQAQSYSLIGTSSAPQARSISFPSSSRNSFGPPTPNSSSHAQPQVGSPFDPSQLPTFPSIPGMAGTPTGSFVLPPLPGMDRLEGGAGGAGLPTLPQLPGQDGGGA